MIIGIWIVIMISAVIVAGEIKYRFFDKKEVVLEHKKISKDWEDNIDTDLDGLSMEYANGEFVSSQSLAMRGSWRLAQDQVMGNQTFDKMRTEEYGRML